MSLDAASSLLSQLTGQVEAGDVVGGKESLGKFKLAMLELPAGHELMVAQALELGVLLTVADGDLEAFGRNVAQLKPYYAKLPQPTPRKAHIVGLNLMHLLVDNRLSEFHSELELLTEQEAGQPLISFPIELERQLMVGIYDKVLNVQVPDPSFQFFVDHLLQTVRDSIADCMEVAYSHMGIAEAQTMMKFDTSEELQEYIQECRDDWIVDSSKKEICFQAPPSGHQATDIPSTKLISQSLAYATEMERII